jgi:hypothetical protein
LEDVLVCDIFDGSIKVWNTANGTLIKNIPNYEGVTSLEVVIDEILALRTDSTSKNSMKMLLSKISKINSCWTISSFDSSKGKTAKALNLFDDILENMK